ncbi:putative transcription factor bHLH041 isoform X2 [Arachis stenosperma]|uniref:putative transcription factor bHLH041 isoform X2 n=1 Tax=Arachis stenosperma TaxID=217475 RepID=UPI0025ACB5A6|nr:putative transcription factor bHLH041 isoform X2 [Arachis stenosperma]
MDGVFNLPEATRSDFLRSLMHTFGCTYICLWHCHSSSNNLLFLDGIYNNVNSTIAEETLFNLYQRLTFDAANDEWVPGAAFKRHMAYLELQQLDLLRLASAVIQTQFYLEARIETAIFMGCSKGEIELGFSTIPQIDMKAAVKSLFPEDFSREQIHHPASSSSCSCPSDEFSSLRGVLLPAPEGEQEAIIRAILHVVISSSSSPATTTSQPPPYNNSAFRAYSSTAYNLVTSSSSRRFSLMKRSIEFSRTLHLMRIRDRFHFQRQHQPPHPLIIGTQNANNNNHLHRIISERRRRENENKCFRELRALLPPGTKKHKSSVLIAAKEALKSLIAEIEKLNIRNQQLKTLLGSSSSSYVNVHISSSPSSSNERLNVAVSHVAGSSSSEERMVDLQVAVRGESSSHHHQSDIMIRILEFLKSLQNLSFVSMAANTTTNTQGTTITQIIFRIRILQGSEWDESGFVEAVRRVVSNLA